MTLQAETISQLNAFLQGRLSAQDLEVWVIGVTDDETWPQREREALETVRLLLLEAGEGIRPLEDAKSESRSILRGQQARTA